MFVAKKDNPELQVYIDYQTLNNVIKKNRYSILLFNIFIDRLQIAKYFTVLNLVSAFHKLRIRQKNK